MVVSKPFQWEEEILIKRLDESKQIKLSCHQAEVKYGKYSVTMQLEKCNLGEDKVLILYVHMLKNNANYSGLLICLK